MAVSIFEVLYILGYVKWWVKLMLLNFGCSLSLSLPSSVFGFLSRWFRHLDVSFPNFWFGLVQMEILGVRMQRVWVGLGVLHILGYVRWLVISLCVWFLIKGGLGTWVWIFQLLRFGLGFFKQCWWCWIVGVHVEVLSLSLSPSLSLVSC